MKFKIFVGNLETVTIEEESIDIVKQILIDNSKQLVTDFLDKLSQLLPEETHVKAIGSVRLSYMSDRWVLKMLKRYPEVKTFAQLNKKINGS